MRGLDSEVTIEHSITRTNQLLLNSQQKCYHRYDSLRPLVLCWGCCRDRLDGRSLSRSEKFRLKGDAPSEVESMRKDP